MSLPPPFLPPAITVHGLDQARAALAPNLPVLLLSGRAAAGYAGAGWWRAMIAASLNDAYAPDALDCSNQAGRALEALHLGCRIIVLEPCPSFAAVAERAQGALILSERPPSLDLAHPGAARHIERWLRGDMPSSLR